MVTPSETLADRIRHVLEARRWSQRELARRASIAETHVNTLLRKLDRDPSASVESKTLQKIAQAAGVSMQWLLTGEGPGVADEPASESESDLPPSGVPTTLGGFAGYREVEATARKLAPEVPEWAWLIARNANPLSIGNAPPSVNMVVELARFIMQHGNPAAVQEIERRKRRGSTA